VTHDEWEAEWNQEYAACLRRKNNPVWAFGRAREIMVEKYGLQPSRDQIPVPGLIAWNKLGLQLKGFRMHTSPAAWFTAFGAACTAASAQFALANVDGVISGGEWGGIAIQFASLLLGTLAKFKSDTPAAPKE
jgi:hypothetical protein